MKSLTKLFFYALATTMLIPVTGSFADSGDSSGGGNQRVLSYKAAVMQFVIPLRSVTKAELAEQDIVVSAEMLDSVLVGKSTKFIGLTKDQSFVISKENKISVVNGRIFENKTSSKDGYFDSSKSTIYIPVDWDKSKSSVALKEVIRAVAQKFQNLSFNIDKQTVNIIAWTDISIGPGIASEYVEDSQALKKLKDLYKTEMCEAAIVLLDRATSEFHHKVMANRVVGGRIHEMLYERSKTPEIYKYGWLKDPEEIKRRIAAHTEIWELKEDAVAGNSVEENVAKIAEYVEDADMRSTAVQALGEIGHPSAAPALIKLLRGHLDVVGTDHDFQMKHHKPSFWAPQAAGSINYTGAGKYYNKVESIFFRMSASPRPGTMLAHGMTLMGTTRFRNALKNGLEIPGVHNARAMATMGDVSFLRPAYLQALSEENERDFAELLWTVELIGLTDRGFANRGMNKSEVFTNLLITAFKKFSVAGATLNFDPFGKDSIPAPNSDILTSLMSLKPKTCK